MINDLGVLPDSVRYYYEPDAFTQEALYHSPHAGIYHCSGDYLYARKASDTGLCQIILVDAGSLYLSYMEKESVLTPGMLAVMHLGTPHLYRAASAPLRMNWIHLTGPGCVSYVNRIASVNGSVLHVSDYPGARERIRALIGGVAKEDRDPDDLSVRIHILLSLLAKRPSGAKKTDPFGLSDCLDYMQSNYADPALTVELLARRESMSVSFFINQFKKAYGTTPHRYLTGIRLTRAKELLDTTSDAVESVAYACGFGSASHFICAFRRDTGMTPLSFRKLWR